MRCALSTSHPDPAYPSNPSVLESAPMTESDPTCPDLLLILRKGDTQ